MHDSSRAYATPLTLEPVSSCASLAVLLAPHLLALVALALAGVALPLRLALAVVVLASSAHALAAAYRVQRLVWGADGGWRVELRDGSVHEAVLQPCSVVTARFALLVFRPSGQRRRRAVLLVPGARGAEAYRRLRVRLRVSRERPGELQ